MKHIIFLLALFAAFACPTFAQEPVSTPSKERLIFPPGIKTSKTSIFASFGEGQVEYNLANKHVAYIHGDGGWTSFSANFSGASWDQKDSTILVSKTGIVTAEGSLNSGRSVFTCSLDLRTGVFAEPREVSVPVTRIAGAATTFVDMNEGGLEIANGHVLMTTKKALLAYNPLDDILTITYKDVTKESRYLVTGRGQVGDGVILTLSTGESVAMTPEGASISFNGETRLLER